MPDFMKTSLLILTLALAWAGSVGADCPVGDLDSDCKVDLKDLEIFARQWLDAGCSGSDCADLDATNGIDVVDFALLADNWLKQGHQLTLLINEFMAKNDGFIKDSHGDYEDWIEIYNYGNDAIDISGMYLTDDLSVPTKWHVPDDNPLVTTIPSHGFLLIWADNETDEGTLHANFKLSTDGEQIGLYDADENLIDSITFDPQQTDISYGRSPDGSDNWRFFNSPTPGTPNTREPANVIISEIMYHPYHRLYEPENTGQEYIELFNKGTESVSLFNWRFSDGVDFVFPDITLGAGEYLAVAADVNTFTTKHPEVTNVVGGWDGRLKNSGEVIELVDAMGVRIDRIHYADEGDWAVRELGPSDYNHRGWLWSDDHDGGGKSLELINPAIPNEYGQNWTASDSNDGTPGATNSVSANDIAPLILNVKHLPIIPGSNDVVTVTARIIDEHISSVTVGLHYRIDSSVYESKNIYPHYNANDYNYMEMFDDGQHDDGDAGDGVYSAQIPAQPDSIIVEFYVEASDAGTNSRTWPALSTIDGASEQVTNALYQVDDSFDPEAEWLPGSQPVYYLIMTEMERGRLAYIGTQSYDGHSHAQMNGTFISIDGVNTKLRYNVGIRNRGEGTRNMPPNNYRVNFRNDDPWKDVRAININSKYPYLQLTGSAIFRMAGLLAANATAVQVRVNGENLAESGQRMYGSYVCLEVYDSDWAERHTPDDSDGNLYEASHWPWTADLSYLGTNAADYVEAGYYKLTNEAQNDWTDLFDLTNVLDNEPDVTYVDEVNRVLNVQQWLHWFAVNSLIGNNENGLGTGVGDDYRMYRGVEDPRFVLLIHDLDTVLYVAHDIPSTNRSIFYVADRGELPVMARFLKHPAFVSEYYAQFVDLIETVFSPEQLSPLLDQLLDDWIPQSIIDEMKQKIAERATNVMQQIPLTFSFSSDLPTSSGFHYTVTNLASLYGRANAIETRSVLVNGQLADWSPLDGVWSIDETIALNPGINRIIVETFDEPNGAGKRLEHGFIDVWYDDSDVSEVSGTLVTDTILDAASGPWQIVDNITIPAGVTLTIEPGTTLFFADGKGITIHGRLIAEGAKYERIRLTRAAGSDSSWKGLAFINSLNDNRMCYVDMEYGDGQNESILIDHSQLLIDNMTWAGTEETVLEVSHPSLIVRNSFLPGIATSEVVHGLYIEGDEYLIMESNTFGICSAGGEDVLDFSGAKRPGPVFQAYNNVFLGGGDDGLDIDGADAHIEGNLFMNFHWDGQRATTSQAIATGERLGGLTSNITVVRNIFFDVDHAVLLKEDCFLHAQNNVFVGATDAVIQFNEVNGTNVLGPGRGAYLDGNIFWDNNDLFKHLADAPEGAVVNRSIVPEEFLDFGTGNLDADPLFIDYEGNFHLKPMSPAIGAGPCGLDMGANAPSGAAICGEPSKVTYHTSAKLTVGGPGITHYKYSLNDPNEPYSEELPIDVPIELTDLLDGQSYTVYVLGMNSAGGWQSTPAASRTWTIDTSYWRLVISEVLAANTTVEHEGTLPDLIELYYDGPAPIQLSRMSITDDPGNPTRFVFPFGLTIDPGEYLVLYADADTTTPGIHLGFALDGDGDAVYLYDRRGILVDSVEFGLQLPDLSIGRVGYDGRWRLAVPTFGQSNIAEPLGDPGRLKVNEWLARGEVLFADDFIELYNPQASPVDLSGLYLTDNPITQPNKCRLGPLSFIAGKGYAVFTADGQNLPGHVGFRLSVEGDMIGLFDAEIKEIDKVLFGPQSSDVSQGSAPDGSTNFEFFELPTPGTANPEETTIFTEANLIVIDDVWSYEQTDTALPANWHDPNYNDSSWPSGPALLYAEDSDLPGPKNTTLTLGAATYYFRKHFYLDAQPNDVIKFYLAPVIDDGAVFYLNGQEVFRLGMSNDVIEHTTRANRTVGNADYEGPFSIPPSGLIQGDNVIAVEVHQSSDTSSDIVFGLRLDAIITSTIGLGSYDQAYALLDGLRITELMYHDPDGNDYDFVELQNIGNVTLDLTDVRLAGGIDYTFPAILLEPGELTVVIADILAFQSKYDSDINIAGEYSGHLSNGGERIILKLAAPLEAAILRFSYDDAWHPTTDGGGDALVILDATAEPVAWNNPENWYPTDPTPGRP